MPGRQPNLVLQYIRKVGAAEPSLTPADGELLDRFLARRDEAAFAMLVRRHGPRVLALCRWILRNDQDAEDAFQATFLVLGRKAPSLRPRPSLGGWLHRVAYRIAQKAKIAAARRRKHEGRAAGKPVADPLAQITLQEAHEVLEKELARLPDKFRLPLVLCYLQGLTRDEAAHQLGWSPSTLKSRLEQARERLRTRLAARGLVLSAALVATLFYERTAAAAVPAVLLDSTVKAATGNAGAPVLSANVTLLSEGVLKAMFRTKMQMIATFLIGCVLVGADLIVLTRQASADKPAAPQQEKPSNPDAK